jgi:nitrite reductase (NADH) small subunit
MSSNISQWQAVCRSGDILSGLGVRALFGEKHVAIFRVQDALYAVDAIDPFTSAAVIARGIVGDLKGQIVVASPIYKQHFNLETGACLEDEAVSLTTFPVREENGKVELGLVA